MPTKALRAFIMANPTWYANVFPILLRYAPLLRIPRKLILFTSQPSLASRHVRPVDKKSWVQYVTSVSPAIATDMFAKVLEEDIESIIKLALLVR